MCKSLTKGQLGVKNSGLDEIPESMAEAEQAREERTKQSRKVGGSFCRGAPIFFQRLQRKNKRAISTRAGAGHRKRWWSDGQTGWS